MTRVPGAKLWIKGIANVRGQLLPIIDLRQFLGSGTTPVNRNTRILVVNHREIPAGLIVDEVLGFRRFAADRRPVRALSGGLFPPRERNVARAGPEIHSGEHSVLRGSRLKVSS
jgi:chemotaxis signal transduction protein